MRALFIGNLFPPHAVGGYEQLCGDVVRRFSARGWECSVLTTNVRLDGVDRAEPEGVVVARELEFYWDDHRPLRPNWWETVGIERRNQRRLHRVLELTRPDVVSIWNMGAMSLSLIAQLHKAGIPMVFCVCDDWLEYGPEADGWSRRVRRRPILGEVVGAIAGIPARLPNLGEAALFCFISHTTRRRAETLTSWALRDATVVYGGIDHTDFPIRDECEGRSWQWRLLYVGRLDPRKGVETAIRALAVLPLEATLDIVGNGDPTERRRLMALSYELGMESRVRFAQTPRSRLRRIYAGADTFVFPSVWAEPFGLTPLEAMACSTPVVASRMGGAAEYLVDDQNCLAFAAGDEHDLASAITRLAADSQLRSRLVAAGRKTAAAFGVDRCAETLERHHRAAAVAFRTAQR